jgi:hypothetical protein
MKILSDHADLPCDLLASFRLSQDKLHEAQEERDTCPCQKSNKKIIIIEFFIYIRDGLTAEMPIIK